MDDETLASELRAMEDLGRRRSRLRTAAFAAAYLVVAAGLIADRSVGVLYAVFIAAPIAAAAAVAITRLFTPRLIAAVAAAHDIDPEALRADRYLID
jgi:S-adenosylmethionine synthetase